MSNERTNSSDRSEAAARAPETATQYLAREQAEIFAARRARLEADAEAERLRTYLKDCRCPCCDARARLRAISYERACASPAAVHCASTDRRDNNSDRAFVVYSDPGPAPKITLADIDAEKAIQSALEAARVSAHPDAGPAGTD